MFLQLKFKKPEKTGMLSTFVWENLMWTTNNLHPIQVKST